MHGTLMHGFKQYVVESYGTRAWTGITKSAHIAGSYISGQPYPDEEFTTLVRATATFLGKTPSVLLEEFGAQIVPLLLGIYGVFVDQSWRTLDLLMNADSVIHKAIRVRDASAQPPPLQPRRISDREVHIDYDSPRRLCALALGICRGVASHYQESIAIEQPECMHNGASRCRIVVRLESS